MSTSFILQRSPSNMLLSLQLGLCWLFILSEPTSSYAAKEIICPYAAGNPKCKSSSIIGFGAPLDQFASCSCNDVRVKISCVFSCCGNVTLSLLVNGKPFNRTIVKSSHTQKNDFIKGNKILVIKTNVEFLRISDSDQGYYTCVLSQGSEKLYSSQQGLLFSDFSFAQVKYTISDIKYAPDLKNTSSASFKTVENLITNEVDKKLNAFHFWNRRVISVYDISNNKVGIRVSFVVLQFVQDKKDRKKFCEVSYKNFGGSFSSFQLAISQSVVIDCCRREVTGNAANQGILVWDYTPVVSRFSEIFSLQCPYHRITDIKHAKRKCSAEFRNGAHWANAKLGNCLKLADLDMDSLSKVKVTNETVLPVSQTLIKLSEASCSLTNSSTISSSVQIIENILLSKTANNEVLDNVLKSISYVLNADASTLALVQQEYNTSNRLLSALDELAKQYEVTVLDSGVSVSTKNLVFMAANVNLNIKMGSQFALNSNSNQLSLLKSNSTFTRVARLIKPVENSSEETAFVPYNMVEQALGNSYVSAVKIYGYVYLYDKLFVRQERSNLSAKVPFNVSRVMSISVMNAAVSNSANKIELSWLISGTNNNRMICSFWDFDLGPNGGWSQNGCSINFAENDEAVCQCNHLTNFALLFQYGEHYGEQVSEINKVVLSIITYIGCGLSLTGLILTMIALIFFSKIRKLLPPKILMGLCISLSSTIFIFLLGVESSSNRTTCGVVAAAVLHYFALSSFMWNIVEGINLYLCFVVIYNSHIHHFMTKACLFAFGLPLLIVAATAFGRFYTDYGGGRYCIVTGISFFASLFAPIIIVLVANIVILVRVMMSLNKSASLNSKASNVRKGRIWFSCACLLGLTWMFGVFTVATSNIVFQYLFCMSASFQGFFLFVFHCLLNKNVKDEVTKVLSGYIPESFRRRFSNAVECQNQGKLKVKNPIVKTGNARKGKYVEYFPKLSQVET